jgi:MerR family transcriptional regulator, light-induced transcriptional regulator
VSSAAPSPPGAVFTVSGAARQLGIPAATLRTWERRHGIGPSGRSMGGHRRYTPDDLLRLRAMRTLVETGVPPAQAAGLAALAAGGPPAGGQPAHVPADAMISPEMLIRAAVSMDAPLLCSMLGDAFARHGVTEAWQQLAVPALRELGDRDPAVAGHVAVEHMLSGSLLTTLLAVITLAPPARTIRPVVLACAEEEQHVLPVYALHAELAGRGVDVRQLGGRVPRQALAHAVSTVHPAAVFVWSQVPVTARPGLLDSLPAGPRIVVGGPGWRDRPPGHAVCLAGSLDEAAAELAGCAFGPTG